MYHIISHYLLFTQDEQGNQEEIGNQQTNTAISMLQIENREGVYKERSGKREKETKTREWGRKREEK